MNFYLQTVSPDEFMEVNQSVTLKGIYTTPDMFSSKELDVEKTLASLLDVMSEDQLLYVHALAMNFRSLLEEGKRLAKFSRQIVLTAGCDAQTLMAVKACRRLNIPAACSGIYQSGQLLLAAANAPERLFIDVQEADLYQDWQSIVSVSMKSLTDQQKPLITAVSIKNGRQLDQASSLGVDSVCGDIRFYRSLLWHPQTQARSEEFREDWIVAYTRGEIFE